MKMSMQRYGAKDKAKEEQYELLVEDQIEFISHELLKGTIGTVWWYVVVIGEEGRISRFNYTAL